MVVDVGTCAADRKSKRFADDDADGFTVKLFVPRVAVMSSIASFRRV